MSTEQDKDEDSGFSFLDELGGVFLQSLPTVINNATKKDTSTQPVAVADQTPVKGDAYLSKNLDSGFFKENWEKLAIGGLVMLGVFAYIAKK